MKSFVNSHVSTNATPVVKAKVRVKVKKKEEKLPQY